MKKPFKSTYLTWLINQLFAQKRLLQRPRHTGQRTPGQPGGLKECCKLPQLGTGRSPGCKRFYAFTALKTHLVTTFLVSFNEQFATTKISTVCFFLLPPPTVSRKHPASTCQWSGRPWPAVSTHHPVSFIGPSKTQQVEPKTRWHNWKEIPDTRTILQCIDCFFPISSIGFFSCAVCAMCTFYDEVVHKVRNINIFVHHIVSFSSWARMIFWRIHCIRHYDSDSAYLLPIDVAECVLTLQGHPIYLRLDLLT